MTMALKINILWKAHWSGGDSMGVILAGALTGAQNDTIKCSELLAKTAFPASLFAETMFLKVLQKRQQVG